MKQLPETVVPIAICGKAPDWYKGQQFKVLAPKYDFFMTWKNNHDDDYYTKCFYEQVLAGLDPGNIVSQLYELATIVNPNMTDICLMCYEKPTSFCHRHLVADWLTANGFTCKEYEF